MTAQQARAAILDKSIFKWSNVYKEAHDVCTMTDAAAIELANHYQRVV